MAGTAGDLAFGWPLSSVGTCSSDRFSEALIGPSSVFIGKSVDTPVSGSCPRFRLSEVSIAASPLLLQGSASDFRFPVAAEAAGSGARECGEHVDCVAAARVREERQPY